jgi:hypothetical protein
MKTEKIQAVLDLLSLYIGDCDGDTADKEILRLAQEELSESKKIWRD